MSMNSDTRDVNSRERVGHGISSFQKVSGLDGESHYFPILREATALEKREMRVSREPLNEEEKSSILMMKQEYYGRVIEREQETERNRELIDECIDIRLRYKGKDTLHTRHTPQKFSDLLGDSQRQRELLSLMINWKNGEKKVKRMLILSGTSGCGKESSIRCSAKAAGLQVIYSSSMESDGATVARRIVELCQNRDISISGKKVVVVKEIDALKAYEPAGNAMIKSLQKIAGIKSAPPIILVCTDFYSPMVRRIQRDAKLRANIQVIQMKAASATIITQRLKDILREESLEDYVGQDALADIASSNKGDFRSSLHTFDWMMLRPPELAALDDCKSSVKDGVGNVFSLSRRLLKKSEAADVIIREVEDFGFLEKICSENSLSLRYTDPMLNSTCILSDALSVADVQDPFGVTMQRNYIVALAFTILSPLTVPQMQFPKKVFQYERDQRRYSTIISSWKDSIETSRTHMASSSFSGKIAREAAPHIYSILNPGVGKGSFDLLSDKDANRVERMKDILLSYGLTYTRQRNGDNSSYELFPEIHALIDYPDGQIQGIPTSEGIKQAIAAEIQQKRVTKENMVRNMGTYKRERSSSRNTQAKEKSERKRKSVSLDTFLFGESRGEKDEEGNERNASVQKRYKRSLSVRYKYFEGFSGCVKRLVKINEFT